MMKLILAATLALGADGALAAGSRHEAAPKPLEKPVMKSEAPEGWARAKSQQPAEKIAAPDLFLDSLLNRDALGSRRAERIREFRGPIPPRRKLTLDRDLYDFLFNFAFEAESGRPYYLLFKTRSSRLSFVVPGSKPARLGTLVLARDGTALMAVGHLTSHGSWRIHGGRLAITLPIIDNGRERNGPVVVGTKRTGANGSRVRFSWAGFEFEPQQAEWGR
ncbi:hypothetical protein [Pseudooceanicola sp.]|uniref:hypothetical protein n=1 Tax=Pseudooceanicola sp. TaxID=1914328 RepID=UPI002603A976|nr:hypothetical protein [Pseudooceanicola sp.]MDF1856305.1 hypothetical protein [Pseudooceanicola sp.]